MSLNDFITRIKKDGASRSNRFSVLISNPASSQNEALIQLYCEQASLPSITFASQPVRSYGEQREVVYDRTFEAVSLTFIIDRQFKVKEYFDKWVDKIIDPTTRLSGYYNEYARGMKITVLDINDMAMYETELFEAYPKTIGAVTLDNNSKDIAKLQVTFNYKHHVNKRLASSATESIQLPRQYIDNFPEYQRELNERLFAVSQIERQGSVAGVGLPSDLSNFYG